jgi:hypothetical protein
MSKYLNEDSRKHHYETIVSATYKKHINYINTMREYANDYKALIEKDIDFPAGKIGEAMQLYQQIFSITQMMLLHIENNLYEPKSWHQSMHKVNQMTDEFEKLTLYGDKNENKTN